jgi:hypothetical protein
MLVLTFNDGDSLLLWAGRSTCVLSWDNVELFTTFPVVLRKPRQAGTHGITIEVMTWYCPAERRVKIGLTVDNGVHVQHSDMHGTDAGVYWAKPE